MAAKPLQAFKALIMEAVPALGEGKRVHIGPAAPSRQTSGMPTGLLAEPQMQSPWAQIVASGGVVGDKQDALQHRRIDLRIYSTDPGEADAIAGEIDAWFECYGGGRVDVDGDGGMTAVLSVDPESGPYQLVDATRFTYSMVYRSYNMEFTEA